ncbi:hypothetical protein MKW94_003554 [Papaver nudicaule]|uniref:SCP domain-containing protein n=1 Tax=Papaver nudicaule TaxID=74823 RepID=A0AA41RKH7_PAPNU|nr:hypothetical protein [Papaver nudicaule]
MKLLFLTVAALLVCVSQAQSTQQDYVNTHNTARAAVYSGDLLTWNSTLEAYAQNVANSRISSCSIQATSPRLYGENIASGFYLTGTQAVNLWVSEKAPGGHYSYPTCAPGYICDHYTQVVWRNSNQLGCARVICANTGNTKALVVCYYSPPGNVAGEVPY